MKDEYNNWILTAGIFYTGEENTDTKMKYLTKLIKKLQLLMKYLDKV